MTDKELRFWNASTTFKERFRILIVSLLDPKSIGDWEPDFWKALDDKRENRKQENWKKAIRGKKKGELIGCIDFAHLEIFANNRKDLFEPLFGRKEKHHLPTWLSDIAKVRNVLAHNDSAKIKDMNKAWICMEQIAEIINDVELQNGLKAINQRIITHEKELLEEKLKEVIKTRIEDIKPFSNTKDNYNILILPFRNPEKNNEIIDIGKNFVNGLEEKINLQNLGLEIKYLPLITYNISYEEAKKIGNEYNADIVIWGNDSKPDSALFHVIYFRYMNIMETFVPNIIPVKGKTGKVETERLIEITEGNIELEIEDIIYCFWGQKYYLNKNYIKALTILKRIKSEKYINEDLFRQIKIKILEEEIEELKRELHEIEELKKELRKQIEELPDEEKEEVVKKDTEENEMTLNDKNNQTLEYKDKENKNKKER